MRRVSTAPLGAISEFDAGVWVYGVRGQARPGPQPELKKRDRSLTTRLVVGTRGRQAVSMRCIMSILHPCLPKAESCKRGRTFHNPTTSPPPPAASRRSSGRSPRTSTETDERIRRSRRRRAPKRTLNSLRAPAIAIARYVAGRDGACSSHEILEHVQMDRTTLRRRRPELWRLGITFVQNGAGSYYRATP